MIIRRIADPWVAPGGTTTAYGYVTKRHRAIEIVSGVPLRLTFGVWAGAHRCLAARVMPDSSHIEGVLSTALKVPQHTTSHRSALACRGRPCGRIVLDPGESGSQTDVRVVAPIQSTSHDPAMRIGFIGFAGDCLISGQLDLQGERLTDHLNAQPLVTLDDVILEGLAGGRVDVVTFTIERSQLCAVLATGPRGAPTLRVPTDDRRIQAQIGPYAVLGRYHGLVGATSLRSFSDRDPMVPLTDATIAYVVDGILEVRDAPVLIVNRDLATWYRDPDDADTADRPGRGATGSRPARRYSPRRGSSAARPPPVPKTSAR